MERPLEMSAGGVAGDCMAELPSDLVPVVLERHARGAAAWPGVAVDIDRFARAVAARLDPQDPSCSLDAMLTDDLYLACGCAAGDAAALAAFERHCGPAISRAFATVGVSPDERADLGQVLRQRLLVAQAGRAAPRIASYEARGSLPAWVRVVAAREAQRMLPRARHASGCTATSSSARFRSRSKGSMIAIASSCASMRSTD